MKNNQLTSMLVGLLFLSTFASVALIYKYNSSLRKLQRLQPELAGPSVAQNLMQNLLNDANQYNISAKNPDLKHILDLATGAAKPKTSAK